MPSRYSEEQKRIAKLLLNGPKTVEELDKELGYGFNEIIKELKYLIKLKVVEKTKEFPTKYKLIQKVVEGVEKRKKIEEQDRFKLRLSIIIEFQGIQEDLLKKQMNEVKEAIKKEKNFTIYDIQEAEPQKIEEHYASFLEINLSVKDFKALMALMFLYGPTSVEVLKPKKFEISMEDLQDGLHSIANAVQSYTTYIAKKMNKEELKEFSKKLYEKNA